MTSNNQQDPKETGSAWPASVAAVEPAWTGIQEVVGQAARATSSLVSKGAHDEHHQHGVLPADSTASGVKAMDADGLEVFGLEKVKHEILVKIRQLAEQDVKHGLGEVARLDIDLEANKGIQFYHPLRYYTVSRPAGVDYLAEIEVQAGNCIHARAFRPEIGKGPVVFHSLDTRPTSEGGAVFAVGEAIAYFDY